MRRARNVIKEAFTIDTVIGEIGVRFRTLMNFLAKDLAISAAIGTPSLWHVVLVNILPKDIIAALWNILVYLQTKQCGEVGSQNEFLLFSFSVRSIYCAVSQLPQTQCSLLPNFFISESLSTRSWIFWPVQPNSNRKLHSAFIFSRKPTRKRVTTTQTLLYILGFLSTKKVIIVNLFFLLYPISLLRTYSNSKPKASSHLYCLLVYINC